MEKAPGDPLAAEDPEKVEVGEEPAEDITDTAEASTSEAAKATDEIESTEIMKKEPIESICSSSALDTFLSKDSKLKVSYEVPSSDAASFVSEKTTGMALPDTEATHPTLKGHEVYSKTEKDAKNWNKEFHGKKVDDDELADEFVTEDMEVGDKAGVKGVKPIAANDEGTTSTFLNPNGSTGTAILLENQKATQEWMAVYAPLYKLIFPTTPGKPQSVVLNEATKVIKELDKQDKESDSTKRKLMIKRKKLFEQFTVLLKDCPPEFKKRRLMELKNLMKKKDPSSNVRTNPKPSTSTSAKPKSEPVSPKKEKNPEPAQLQPELLTPKVEVNTEVDLPGPVPTDVLQSSMTIKNEDPLATPAATATATTTRPMATAITLTTPMYTGHLTPASSSSPVYSMTGAPVAAPVVHPESTAPNGITPYTDVTGLKTVKKDGKVMRPMNAFMLWAKDHRKALISNGYDGATVSKMLADQWKILTDEQKQKYYQDAEHLKNLHMLQHPDYKYSPKSRKKPVTKYPISGLRGYLPIAPVNRPSGSNGPRNIAIAPNNLLTQHQQIVIAPQRTVQMPIRIAGQATTTLNVPVASLPYPPGASTLTPGSISETTVNQLEGSAPPNSQIVFDGEALRIRTQNQQQAQQVIITQPGQLTQAQLQALQQQGQIQIQGQGQGQDKDIVEISID